MTPCSECPRWKNHAGDCACFRLLIFTCSYIEGNPSAVAERRIPKRSLRSGVQVVSEIASGLMYLHVEHGIIHRDLKPENVMFSAQGRVRIGDFGLSAFALAEGETRHVVGTPAYMAPELLKHLVVECNRVNAAASGASSEARAMDDEGGTPSLKAASADACPSSSEPALSSTETKTTNSQLDVYAFGIICWEVLAQRSVEYVSPPCGSCMHISLIAPLSPSPCVSGLSILGTFFRAQPACGLDSHALPARSYKTVRDEAELAEEVVGGKRPPLDAVTDCCTNMGKEELRAGESSVIKALSQLIETTWASRPGDRPRFQDIVPALASIQRKLNRSSQRPKKSGRASKTSTRRVAFQPMAVTRSGSAPHLQRESFGGGGEEEQQRQEVAGRCSKMPSMLLSSSPPESLLHTYTYSARWKRNNTLGGHEDPVCWNLPPDFFGERARSMTSSSSLSLSAGTGTTTASTGSISGSSTSISSGNGPSPGASSHRSIETSAGRDSTRSKKSVLTMKVARTTCCHTQAIGAFITRAWVSMWTRCGLIFPDASYEATFLKHHYFTPRYFRALLGVGICACLLYIVLAAMLMYSTSPAGLIVYVLGAVQCGAVRCGLVWCGVAVVYEACFQPHVCKARWKRRG